MVDAVGQGVEAALLGLRVWIWEAAHLRPSGGTAQEYAVVPARQVVFLPDVASFDLGASLGVPFLTAHRCLTVTEDGPTRLGPGTLEGRTVLVAGGAGAVGNAAIQLARWSDATVITTVSGPEKGHLAARAGADHVIDYTRQDVVADVRAIAPDGVNTIVEVSPAVNAASTQRCWPGTARWRCMPTTAGAPWSFPFAPRWCRTSAGSSSWSTTPRMPGVFVPWRTWPQPCRTGPCAWGRGRATPAPLPPGASRRGPRSRRERRGRQGAHRRRPVVHWSR